MQKVVAMRASPRAKPCLNTLLGGAAEEMQLAYKVLFAHLEPGIRILRVETDLAFSLAMARLVHLRWATEGNVSAASPPPEGYGRSWHEGDVAIERASAAHLRAIEEALRPLNLSNDLLQKIVWAIAHDQTVHVQP